MSARVLFLGDDEDGAVTHAGSRRTLRSRPARLWSEIPVGSEWGPDAIV